jgi:hypothetical protein
MGKAGTRVVHPGGYVLWNHDTYALENDLLSSFQGDRVLVVETETGIGIAFESLKDSDLMPAVRVTVNAKVKPVD